MSETISMEVGSRVPKTILERIYSRVTPRYVRGLLKEHELTVDPEVLANVAFSYKRFPTEDLALKVFKLDKGLYFWGIASGCENRFEKVSVKYSILEYIQRELAKSKIKAEINIAGLNRESIIYMKRNGILPKKIPELERIAKEKGNMTDWMIELTAVCGR